MNPTPEQINQWSAEILEKSKVLTLIRTDGRLKQIYIYPDWCPSTDLSQAWRELVPVLNKKGWCIRPTVLPDGDTDCELYRAHDFKPAECFSISGQGGYADQKAAYALTWAFVQALGDKSPGYMKWMRAA